jgi:outer membrane biosynthesis protein TonB
MARAMSRLASLPLLPLLATLAVVASCTGQPAPPPGAPAARGGTDGPAARPASPADALAPTTPPRDAAAGWGEPDMPKVQKLFKQRFAEVKRCYEAELQQHQDARGKLTLRFTIAESGAIRGVSVARSTFARRDVPACVAEVVGRWTTPFRPAEPVEVEYPFSFAPR